VIVLHGFGFERVLITNYFSESRFKLAAARLELRERQDLRLVSIYQSLDAALDLRASPSEVPPMGLSFLAAQPAIAKPLHRVVEHCRLAEQLP
jgi:hypothetical protein